MKKQISVCYNKEKLFYSKYDLSNLNDKIAEHRYAKEILTKEYMSLSEFVLNQVKAIMFCFFSNYLANEFQQKNNVNLYSFPILTSFFAIYIVISIDRYQNSTSNEALEPVLRTLIENPEFFSIKNSDKILIKRKQRLLDDASSFDQFGVFNNHTNSIPPDTFFPYYGKIDVIKSDDYHRYCQKNLYDVYNTVKVFEFSLKQTFYMCLIGLQQENKQKNVGLLYYCNFGLSQKEFNSLRVKFPTIKFLGESNAIFTQVHTRSGLQSGVLVTDEILKDQEVLIKATTK